MQTNPALYANFPNGQFANSTWVDKDGNTVTFITSTATLNGNIWDKFNGKALTSKETTSDSITIFENGVARFRFTLSDITLSDVTTKPSLLLSGNVPIAFFEKE